MKRRTFLTTISASLAVGAPESARASSGASITILKTSTSSDGCAPYGAWFECTVTGFDVTGPTGGDIYDKTLHEIDYYWTFDEIGETYSAPDKLIAAHNDKNVGFAPKIGHTFTQPGSYDVTVLATDRSGNTATDTVTITVNDADTHSDFAGNKTICVARDNTFTGVPTGAQTFNTLAAGISAYRALGSTGRLLLKRGEFHTVTSDWRVDGGYSDNFRLGAWGSGAKPILHSATGGRKIIAHWTGAGVPFVVDNIKFTCTWDEDNLAGSGQGAESNGIWIESKEQAVISECDFDAGAGIYMYKHAEYVFINDMISTSWATIQPVFATFWCSDCTLTMTGAKIARSSLSDGSYNNNRFSDNAHGPIRLEQVPKFYMTALDLFSKSSWGATTGLDQPCIRIHTEGQGLNHYGVVERCVLEGGYDVLAMGNAADGVTSWPCNVIYQANYMLGYAPSTQIIGNGMGGLTIRNNILVQPAKGQQSLPGAGFVNFIGFKIEGTDPENLATPINVYNNTFVNLQDDSDNSNTTDMIDGSTSFTDVRDNNNIEYVPNRTSTNQRNADIPLTANDLLPTARYLGLIYVGAPTLNTAYATPNGGALDYAPDTGSAALNDTTGVEVAHRDFYGDVRGANSDRGAVQKT